MFVFEMARGAVVRSNVFDELPARLADTEVRVEVDQGASVEAAQEAVGRALEALRADRNGRVPRDRHLFIDE